MVGPVHSTGSFTIGAGGVGTLHTRHISGKDHRNDNASNLYLNWGSMRNVYIGRASKGSLIVAGTAYSNWFRAQGNTGFFFQKWKGGFYMQDNIWVRTYGSKSFYHRAGQFRTDGTLQVGPSGNRMIVKSDNVGIKTINPVFNLTVNGSAGKTGGGDWATLSDKKVKKNINQFEDGLEKVLQINPVTFQYNGKAGIENTEKTYVGVIAQEIQKVAPYTVDKLTYEKTEEVEEDGQLKTKTLSSEEFLQFDGTAIRYMLVNAIKEQQVMINELREKVEELRKGSTYHSGNADHQLVELENNIKNRPLLFQNIPNPYIGMTKVDYYLPENSNGLIRFYTLDGQILKEEVLDLTGYASIEIDASKIPSGNFIYALIVDGSIIDSKTMVVVK